MIHPGCIVVPFIPDGWHLPDTAYLALAEHECDILQPPAPFWLEVQNYNRLAVISSQEPPVLLHCPADALPAVVSARQGRCWIGIELDNVTAATTVVLHVKSAPHGIKVLVGEQLSKAGQVAKHKHFRVRVSEHVYAVQAHNGRWRSNLVVPAIYARYAKHPAHEHVACTLQL